MLVSARISLSIVEPPKDEVLVVAHTSDNHTAFLLEMHRMTKDRRSLCTLVVAT